MKTQIEYKTVEHDKNICFLRIVSALQQLREEESKAKRILISMKALEEIRDLL